MIVLSHHVPESTSVIDLFFVIIFLSTSISFISFQSTERIRSPGSTPDRSAGLPETGIITMPSCLRYPLFRDASKDGRKYDP